MKFTITCTCSTAVTLALQRATDDVNEGDGFAIVRVILLGGTSLAQDVSFTITTSDDGLLLIAGTWCPFYGIFVSNF